MQAHSWIWGCNFHACTLLGVLVHQCLCSLLYFFLYYLLIKDKNSSKTFAHVILLNFWDMNIIPKVPWIQFYSTALMILYFSPLVKLPFQEAMQFGQDILMCLLRQENRKVLGTSILGIYTNCYASAPSFMTTPAKSDLVCYPPAEEEIKSACL